MSARIGVSRAASSRARTSIRFSSRLPISTTPSDPQPPGLTTKTDTPTLFSADILALRLQPILAYGIFASQQTAHASAFSAIKTRNMKQAQDGPVARVECPRCRKKVFLQF
jgi:hypothetical protein